MDYYVFETEQEAILAANWISEQGGTPIFSVNAKTRQLEPEKAKTERWAIPQKRIDGKWVFQQVPDEKAILFGQEAIEYFMTNFNYTTEAYSINWFLQE